jgi:hypothetical protein
MAAQCPFGLRSRLSLWVLVCILSRLLKSYLFILQLVRRKLAIRLALALVVHHQGIQLSVQVTQLSQ